MNDKDEKRAANVLEFGAARDERANDVAKGYTLEQLAEIGRRTLVALAPTKREPTEFERRKNAEKRNGIQLKGERLETARQILSDINLAAVSSFHLARSATDGNMDPEWTHVAIENMAKVIARKCDVLSGLLGEDSSFGNFEEEFSREAPVKVAAR